MSVADLQRMFDAQSKRFEDCVLTSSREIQGATSATPLPTVTAKFVMFKTMDDNAGKVYIGATGVTIPNGTTDATSGWPLVAGEQYGPIPCTNLNNFSIICDNAGDDLIVHVFE